MAGKTMIIGAPLSGKSTVILPAVGSPAPTGSYLTVNTTIPAWSITNKKMYVVMDSSGNIANNYQSQGAAAYASRGVWFELDLCNMVSSEWWLQITRELTMGICAIIIQSRLDVVPFKSTYVDGTQLRITQHVGSSSAASGTFAVATDFLTDLPASYQNCAMNASATVTTFTGAGYGASLEQRIMFRQIIYSTVAGNGLMARVFFAQNTTANDVRYIYKDPVSNNIVSVTTAPAAGLNSDIVTWKAPSATYLNNTVTSLWDKQGVCVSLQGAFDMYNYNSGYTSAYRTPYVIAKVARNDNFTKHVCGYVGCGNQFITTSMTAAQNDTDYASSIWNTSVTSFHPRSSVGANGAYT